MSSFKGLAAAAAVVFAIGCGNGVDRVPEEEGGGAGGLGEAERTTPAERTSAAGGGRMALSEQERQFVEKVSQGNQMEVALGNMAEDKAQNDDVKQLGEQIASDHSSAERKLQSSLGGGDATTAQSRGGQMPEGAEGEQMQQKFEKLSGAEFDRAYLDEMVKHHQRNIQEFERQAEQTDNEQLRSYIEQTLPTLREHLERAQQLQKQTR